MVLTSFSMAWEWKVNIISSSARKCNSTHIHVGLVIPRLHIEEDRGFRDHFGLLGLLLVVGLQPLLSDPLLLLVIGLLVRPEEVDVIVLLLCGSWGGLGSRGRGGTSFEFVHSGLQRQNKRLEVVSDFLQFLVLNLQGTEF